MTFFKTLEVIYFRRFPTEDVGQPHVMNADPMPGWIFCNKKEFAHWLIFKTEILHLERLCPGLLAHDCHRYRKFGGAIIPI